MPTYTREPPDKKMRTAADATAKSANADAAAKWVLAQKGRTAYSATKKGAQWHNLCSTGAVQARVEKLRGVSALVVALARAPQSQKQELLGRWLTSRWLVRQHDRRLGCGAGVCATGASQHLDSARLVCAAAARAGFCLCLCLCLCFSLCQCA